MIVKANDFISFLKKVDKEKIDGFSEVIVPAKPKYSTNGHTYFHRISEDNEIVLDSFRTVDPIKILFYLVRESMNSEKTRNTKRIIVGVKQCDLKALELTDIALINKNFIDPGYKHWRENTLIISSDCGEIGENCSCNLMDGKPYPGKGFDINISSIHDNYFLQAGSPGGEKFLVTMSSHIGFETCKDVDTSEIQKKREKIFASLEERNSSLRMKRDFINLKLSDLELWKDESTSCVGCGACTNICPTCYCLILNDETEAQEFMKVRSYDSCQWNGYARVAGGGTPRPKMFERFRNRYLCKYLYMKSNFGLYGCTGCGRCTEACPGKISFMKVVKNTAESFSEIAQ
ncbi:MAG: 4Fe-4S dicluster domain-containing protein [Melioribacteraceae bacterium]|nr:4Fe-4S dicluster domain-containing protein [Melioribacteraceae bacterium]